jgi:hypothetical protein
VIDATVLKQLDANLVRIAIANLTIEVLSEVPLQPGQKLQLAVSQTPQGVRLQIVPGEVRHRPQPERRRNRQHQCAEGGCAGAGRRRGRVLTNLEALAVSAAVQSAATRQGSLSPLFAISASR